MNLLGKLTPALLFAPFLFFFSEGCLFVHFFALGLFVAKKSSPLSPFSGQDAPPNGEPDRGFLTAFPSLFFSI